MNLFVPIDNSLTESVLCLDDMRLNKQGTEAGQVRNIIYKIKHGISKSDIPWSRHSVIPMWIDNIKAVEHYHDLCIAEWIRREKNNTRKYFKPKGKIILPDWYGRKDIHAAYRSKLLFKGSVDAVVKTLEIAFKSRYFKWRDQYGLPEKNQITHEHRKLLLDIVKYFKLTLLPNHYHQFNWKEPDDLSYVWDV